MSQFDTVKAGARYRLGEYSAGHGQVMVSVIEITATLSAGMVRVINVEDDRATVGDGEVMPDYILGEANAREIDLNALAEASYSITELT